MTPAKARSTPILIAAAMLAASCAAPPARAPASGSPATQGVTADELLANAVYSQLNADPVYYYRHVEVRVDHGVAHLSGYVWSADAIYRARRIAQSVPGVTRVVTGQLELERNGRDSGVAR